MVGVFAVAWLAGLWMTGVSLRVDRSYLAALAALGMYLGVVLLGTISRGGQDLALAKNALGFFTNVIPGALLLGVWAKWRDRSFRDLLDLVFIVYVVHAVVVILTAVLPSFRDVLEFAVPARSNIVVGHGQYEYRFRGLFNSAGAGASALFAFAIMIGVLALRPATAWRSLLTSLGIVAILFGIVLTGRSGLVMLAMLLLFRIVAGIGRRIFYRRETGPTGARYVFLVILLLGVFAWWNGLFSPDGRFWANAQWIAQDVILLARGEIQGTTLQILYNMIIIPNDLRIWLFGDVTTFDVNRLPTDLGFLRMLWGVGLIGGVLLYSVGAILFLKIRSCSRTSRDRSMWTAIALLVLFIELKEPFFIDLRFSSLYFLLFSYHAVNMVSPRKPDSPRDHDA